MSLVKRGKIRDEPRGSRARARSHKGVLESGICPTETRIKNGRTPAPGISNSIGMCRECPPGDVLTPCHSVELRVPKYPFGTFLRARVSRPKIRGRMPDHSCSVAQAETGTVFNSVEFVFDFLLRTVNHLHALFIESSFNSRRISCSCTLYFSENERLKLIFCTLRVN